MLVSKVKARSYLRLIGYVAPPAQSGVHLGRPSRDGSNPSRCEVVEFEGDFGAVPGLQLLHDAADMNLHRALTEIQFIGDNLIGLAPGDPIGHRGLPCREQLVRRGAGSGSFRRPLLGLHQAAGRFVPRQSIDDIRAAAPADQAGLVR